jgi:uncharacterized membrane protein YhaH (DUF805 family)
MNEAIAKSKITATDRLMLQLLGWAPLLAFFLIALPLPLYFLLRRLTAIEEPGAYILLAFVSLAAGSIIGFIVAMLLLLYRQRWQKRRREQLAADGITTSELAWFKSELTASERKALKRIEAQNPLLADAYRETLAARLTATRVLLRAKRELVEVEGRSNRAAYSTALEAKDVLQKELQADAERLNEIKRAAEERESEIALRLQSIEALAERNASEAETEIALQRLDAARDTIPLGLEAARSEQENRRQIQSELRKLNQ